MTAPTDDLLDLAGVAAILRAGWRQLLAFASSGILVGIIAVMVIPPRWEGRASVLTSRTEPGMFGAANGVAGLASSAVLGGSIGGSLTSQTETDLALLRSHRLLLEVGDEVPLSARLRHPRLPLSSVVTSFRPAGAFRPLRLVAEAEGGRWRLRGRGVDTLAIPGQPIRLSVGTLTLATGVPDRFELTLYDLEEGLARSARRVEVTRDGGNILQVAVRWEDSVTGARIANGLIDRYLTWRQDADAGENAERIRFVTAQLDSTQAQLDGALGSLRRYQEASGQLDPEQTGSGLLQLATDLNARLRVVVLEAQALETLFGRVGDGSASVRTLTGFPTFLRSQTLNDLLTELVKLESERATFLATRTLEDPAVAGRTEAIRILEAQLLPIARTYRASLAEDRARLVQAVDSVADRLAELPGQGQQHFLLVREVKRLNELSIGLETQLVQLRLATVGEGGTARQVDQALVPRRPVYPRRALTIVAGGALGLLIGLTLVLFAAPRRRNASVT